MKADFKKWMKDKGIPIEDYLSFYANQFAEDYAKQEAIEFADYYFKNYRELINEFRADTGKAYQKFKDET